jgi:predicted transcriptional regulator
MRDLSGWYIVAMTKLLEQALRQIEQLPERDQDAAAGALLDYLKHMHDVRLTDAQVAEARRRRSDPNRILVSHAEARERIRRLGS